MKLKRVKIQTISNLGQLFSHFATDGSDHIYAIVQPKDKRISTTSSASLASSSLPLPNLLDLIPPPPTYPPSPPLLSKRKQLKASEATEETSRLLVPTDECDGSLNQENGYAKLKNRTKNKVPIIYLGTIFLTDCREKSFACRDQDSNLGYCGHNAGY